MQSESSADGNIEEENNDVEASTETCTVIDGTKDLDYATPFDDPCEQEWTTVKRSKHYQSATPFDDQSARVWAKLEVSCEGAYDYFDERVFQQLRDWKKTQRFADETPQEKEERRARHAAAMGRAQEKKAKARVKNAKAWGEELTRILNETTGENLKRTLSEHSGFSDVNQKRFEKRQKEEWSSADVNGGSVDDARSASVARYEKVRDRSDIFDSRGTEGTGVYGSADDRSFDAMKERDVSECEPREEERQKEEPVLERYNCAIDSESDQGWGNEGEQRKHSRHEEGNWNSNGRRDRNVSDRQIHESYASQHSRSERGGRDSHNNWDNYESNGRRDGHEDDRQMYESSASQHERSQRGGRNSHDNWANYESNGRRDRNEDDRQKHGSRSSVHERTEINDRDTRVGSRQEEKKVKKEVVYERFGESIGSSQGWGPGGGWPDYWNSGSGDRGSRDNWGNRQHRDEEGSRNWRLSRDENNHSREEERVSQKYTEDWDRDGYGDESERTNHGSRYEYDDWHNSREQHDHYYQGDNQDRARSFQSSQNRSETDNSHSSRNAPKPDAFGNLLDEYPDAEQLELHNHRRSPHSRNGDERDRQQQFSFDSNGISMRRPGCRKPLEVLEDQITVIAMSATIETTTTHAASSEAARETGLKTGERTDRMRGRTLTLASAPRITTYESGMMMRITGEIMTADPTPRNTPSVDIEIHEVPETNTTRAIPTDTRRDRDRMLDPMSIPEIIAIIVTPETGMTQEIPHATPSTRALPIAKTVISVTRGIIIEEVSTRVSMLVDPRLLARTKARTMTTATREVASTRAPSTLHAKQSTIVRRSGRDRRIVYMTDQINAVNADLARRESPRASGSSRNSRADPLEQYNRRNESDEKEEMERREKERETASGVRGTSASGARMRTKNDEPLCGYLAKEYGVEKPALRFPSLLPSESTTWVGGRTEFMAHVYYPVTDTAEAVEDEVIERWYKEGLIHPSTLFSMKYGDWKAFHSQESSSDAWLGEKEWVETPFHGQLDRRRRENEIDMDEFRFGEWTDEVLHIMQQHDNAFSPLNRYGIASDFGWGNSRDSRRHIRFFMEFYENETGYP
ncbi:hypothetical protein PRIPAC_88134 [Pristionchus pacificus]|uniref:Uncharacterized protein n=1 Tax=Pristionchus pacificus TaxID=54126 RepID=A0A2A6CWE0_PRIPA|nr:hypothetical protein PRIPAC_88134 [Pristionchus pacificus]|eukprot:PDM82353.1 hypothetical protein PRIPAC_36746 [Pristionchus pacificus]